MDLVTVGINYYLNYNFDAYITNDIEMLKNPLSINSYKIIFMEYGTIHIKLNGNEYILTGANALCLNEKDEIWVYDISGREITILFFKPSVINNKLNFESINNNEMLSISEYQDGCYLSQFKHKASLAAKFTQIRAIDASIMKQKFHLLNEQLTLQNSSFWPCRSRSYLFEILFSLAKPEENKMDDVANKLDSSYTKLTIDVIYYIQTCYNQKITIEKLSQEFHTNRTTLLKEFKDSTGQSINRYITQLRMTMATALLRDTDLSIQEICERTGFSEISYFSKLFKKEIQFTPLEYRRINAS
ncbi:MAG: transcriptional regulator, AraC family [Clostridiales bacterium]|jgi:AraC family L-rhamnose operon regulatory protein RhaS|nr:transcriptional regulator, AraC family [Clostridiales bacterium]